MLNIRGCAGVSRNAEEHRTPTAQSSKSSEYQELLHKQHGWRLYVDKEVVLEQNVYDGCACTRAWEQRKRGGKSTRNQTCAIHRERTDVGLREVHDLVHGAAPHALRICIPQAPIMSLDKQGRDHRTGCFASGADMFADLMVQDSRNLWFAFEVDGPNHKCAEVRKRDTKKRRYLKSKSIPLIRLKWQKRGALPLEKWREIIVDKMTCV